MCKAKVFYDLKFTKPEMGAMDFTYLVFYALGNVVGGFLNGKYSSIRITSTSFFLLGIFYSFTILFQFWVPYSAAYMWLFAFIGLF